MGAWGSANMLFCEGVGWKVFFRLTLSNTSLELTIDGFGLGSLALRLLMQ